MANRHYGNLADVFKHLALCEALGAMRPGEYWESHAGAATYAENGTVPAERAHGIHHFAALLQNNDTLRLSGYGKIIGMTWKDQPLQIPGSTLLARTLLGENIRRYLLCDIDDDSLQSVQQTLLKKGVPPHRELPQDKLECVHDDGISVLRGAGVLLPEKWTNSTLAFLDPEEFASPTDAGITALELACELGNRGVPVLMFYSFKDAESRVARTRQLQAGLEKGCLAGKSVCIEGNLKAPPPAATQWGFGLMGLCLRPDAVEAMDQKLRALAGAYEKATLGDGTGAWQYSRAIR
jgi:23S rRNA A2030 N6-methylase RlmJ